jgi:hypothetical protein
VVLEGGDEDRAAGAQQHAEDDPAGALGGHVQHDHEEAEEEQRGAQVGLEDQDQQADGPDDEDRAQVAAAGQVEPHEAAAGQREGVPLDHQVAGEEDGDDDLRELTGLEGADARDGDPDLGAVDAREEDREDQQYQRHHHGDVGVALQDPVVLEEDQHTDEQGHAERGPQQLAGRHGGAQ